MVVIRAKCLGCGRVVGTSYYSNTNTMGTRCWKCNADLTSLYNQELIRDTQWDRLNRYYELCGGANKPSSFTARVKSRLSALWHTIKS